MSVSRRLVSVVNLGRIGYNDAWRVQQHIAHQLRKTAGLDENKTNEILGTRQDKRLQKDTLLICEHNPVYTVGIRTNNYSYEEENRLTNLGAEFYRTDRGGLITYHGPGQLVAYPILNLGHFKKSVRWYVCQLEKCVIELCKAYGIKGETSPHTGVWVRESKIAAIGIHCKRFITSHGLALNCNTDMNWFNNIVPCGIVGKGVTSLTKELDRQVTIEDALPVFVNCFKKQFDCDIEWTNLDFDVKDLMDKTTESDVS